MVGTRWESSNRPLFVKTVWQDGHHHVVLQKEEPISTQTARSARRKTSCRKIPPPSPEKSNFKVPSVKLLLASLRNIKSETRTKRCMTETKEFIKSVTVDIIPSDSVRYNDLNKQVSFNCEKRHLKFAPKSNSVEVQHCYRDDSNFSTPPPFSYDNYWIDQNSSLSERVMIWLDLAVQNQKQFKNFDLKKRIVTAHACPIIERTKIVKPEIVSTNFHKKIEEKKESTPELEVSPLVTSQMECEQLNRVTPNPEKKFPVRTSTAKRQLHIFIPNIPKKCSDSGSFLSSKSSSLLLQANKIFDQ